MKNFVILAFFSVYLFASVNGVTFTDCGSGIGKWTKVLIPDCEETKDVCVLRKNTTANIAFDFVLEKQDECPEVKTVVHGIIMGMVMPFPLPNPNACKDSGITCPLRKDQTYEYSATLPVLRSYPKVRVDVKWELQTSTGENIVCLLIPAKIE